MLKETRWRWDLNFANAVQNGAYIKNRSHQGGTVPLHLPIGLCKRRRTTKQVSYSRPLALPSDIFFQNGINSSSNLQRPSRRSPSLWQARPLFDPTWNAIYPTYFSPFKKKTLDSLERWKIACTADWNLKKLDRLACEERGSVPGGPQGPLIPRRERRRDSEILSAWRYWAVASQCRDIWFEDLEFKRKKMLRDYWRCDWLWVIHHFLCSLLFSSFTMSSKITALLNPADITKALEQSAGEVYF